MAARDLKVIENNARDRLWNRLCDEIDKLRVEVIAPLRISRTLSGTQISYGGQPGTAGGGITYYPPFSIVPTAVQGSSLYVWVCGGSVNINGKFYLIASPDTDPSNAGFYGKNVALTPNAANCVFINLNQIVAPFQFDPDAALIYENGNPLYAFDVIQAAAAWPAQPTAPNARPVITAIPIALVTCSATSVTSISRQASGVFGFISSAFDV